MSINFGYGGYGMMNNMNMMGGMQGYGGGNTFQSISAQYSCPMCYQNGPVPYNYQTFVNPLPPEVSKPSFFSRIFRRIMGG